MASGGAELGSQPAVRIWQRVSRVMEAAVCEQDGGSGGSVRTRFGVGERERYSYLIRRCRQGCFAAAAKGVSLLDLKGTGAPYATASTLFFGSAGVAGGAGTLELG